MANVLEDIEYRILKTQLPSWRVDENYTEWTDCGQSTQFPDGTEFRIKEKTVYVVTFNSRKDLETEDKTRAMARVAKLLEDDFEVSINKFTRTVPHIGQFLAERNVQFKLKGSERWMSPNHFGGSNKGSAISFRFRPDHYFQVNVQNGIAISTLDFDDVDVVSDYVDRQLRTSENSIHITRRPYGITI